MAMPCLGKGVSILICDWAYQPIEQVLLPVAYISGRDGYELKPEERSICNLKELDAAIELQDSLV